MPSASSSGPRQRVRRAFQTGAWILAWLLVIPVAILAFVSALDQLDMFPPEFFLHGIDFFPALWLAVLAIPGFGLMVLAGRWRSAIILAVSFSAYVIAFGDISFEMLFKPSVPSSPASVRIRTVALNVQYYTRGLDSVVTALGEMEADLILLSENAFDDPQQEIKFASMMAPMHYVAGHRNSTAILSRYPILQAKEVELPSHEASLSGGNDIAEQSTHPHRSFVHALLDVHGVRTHAIAIRLIAGRPKNRSIEEHVRWGKYLLATQMEEVKFFEEYVRTLDGPVIFGGDLNAPPRSKVMRQISRFATDAYFADHFWGDLTFRTELPTLRLDYLFCMNGVIPVRSKRLHHVVSDHFPVWAEFLLTPQGNPDPSQKE